MEAEGASTDGPPAPLGHAASGGRAGASRDTARDDKQNKYGLQMSTKALKLLGVFEDEKEHRGAGTMLKASRILGIRPDSKRVAQEAQLHRLRNLRKKNVISFEEFVAMRAESNEGDQNMIVHKIIARLSRESRKRNSSARRHGDHGSAANVSGAATASARATKPQGLSDNIASAASSVDRSESTPVFSTFYKTGETSRGAASEGDVHKGELHRKGEQTPRRRSSLTDAERLSLGVRARGISPENSMTSGVGLRRKSKSSETRTSDLVEEQDSIGLSIKRPKSPYATFANKPQENAKK